MPKLKNPRHELLAKNIVKSKFNLTKAYKKTYPDSASDSARANVHRTIANDSGIYNRVMELAEAQYTPEYIVEDLLSFREATRPIVVEKELIDYPDYATRLENTKTVLKMYGVLGKDGSGVNIDARSVNVVLDSPDVNRLEDVARMMQGLRARLETESGDGGVGGESGSTSP